LTAVGGTSPYTYDVGNGAQNSTVFNNIAAAVYNVTITDASGCTFDTVVTIQEPTGMTISLNTVDPTCYNTCDASVEASVSGGVIANDPIYEWSGALATNIGNSVSNICINNYTLTVIDDNGCEEDTTFSFVAPVDIIADFSVSPQPTTMFNPEITLTEESLNGIIFTWFVDSIEVGTGSPLQYDYPGDSAGVYTTCLLVEDLIGCSDSVCKEVIIDNDFIVFLPNTFTPDGDGDNDFFFPKGLGLNLVDYELVVFDRWGELVWTSSSVYPKWDGTHKGKQCQQGAYVWKLKTIDQGSNNIERVGHVNLLR
jgi:gliding motility-associated-like protein